MSMSATMNRLRRCAAAAAIAALAAASPARAESVLGEIDLVEIPPSIGVPYTWEAEIGSGERVEFVMNVAAKSWNDPTNPEGSKGWTHMVHWVALDLKDAAMVKIRVVRQPGVLKPDASYTLARNDLYPAISIYAGTDEITEHGHSFNQIGNFWADVDYLGHATATEDKPTKVVYKAQLAAGKYTIAIGGNPPSLGALGNYPSGSCNVSNPTCYTYTGQHGYNALIKAR